MTEQVAERAAQQNSVTISVNAASRLNVAFHQNQVPAIGGIELQNCTSSDLLDVTVEVTSVPEFLVPKRFIFDKIKAGGLQHLTPVPISLNPAFLLVLSERIRGEIIVTVSAGDSQLAQIAHACELLSPNEWTGTTSAPELIAAFVRPNDPIVDSVLRRAAAKLERAGRSSALSGYSDGKKSRVWEVAEAIWAALCDEAITYALPPASFETDGQKIRSPSAVLEHKIATCLDLTLLLAACYEQAGLNPVIVVTQGHAFVGLWLIAQEFAQAVIDEPQVLRKRRDLEDIILIETTLLTQKQRFSAAVSQGRSQIDEGAQKPLELAVDVKRARMRQIKPLHWAEVEKFGHDEIELAPAAEMGLAEAPSFADEVSIKEDSLTTLSRLERWKRKLLDLSLRNKLLNFKVGTSSVRLVCPNPGLLEDRLAAGDKLSIEPKANVMEGADPRSAELNIRIAGNDAALEYANEALRKGFVHTDLEATDLDARLTDLFRRARGNMEESGANSLHLALGFVRWAPTSRRGGDYRAPLILLPVTLERKTAGSKFKLVRHDDDARVNPTLLQMLRQDFHVSIPEFEDAELPMDASGLDVKKIWSITRKHLLDAKAFELTEDIVLSTFSFTKYLMWKDLVDRTDVLKRNRVVAHLIDTPTSSYGDGKDLPDEARLDSEITSKSLLMPLPADSSQTAAVLAGSLGKDFVLFGPPGTGKSQTIANLIVNLLGEGKTVLFVSQKTTALEVVRKRLDQLGIGDFCLEVHSAKAQKSAVLGQLKHAWEQRATDPVSQWSEKADELDQLRARLNEVVGALHKRRRNGMTAYSAFGRVIAGRDWNTDLRLSFPDPEYHDETAMRRLRELCGKLRIALGDVGDPSSHPLRLIRTTDWSPSWNAALSDAVRDFQKASAAYKTACTPIAALFGIEIPARPGATTALQLLCDQVFRPEAPEAIRLLESDTAELRRLLEKWCECGREIAAVEKKLSCTYSFGVYRQDFASLLEEWRQAVTANFLVRNGRKKKVWQALSPFTQSPQPEDLGAELAALMEVAAAKGNRQEQEERMRAFGTLWVGEETEPTQLANALDWVDETRSKAGSCAADGLDKESWLKRARQLLFEKPHELREGGTIDIAYRQFHAASQTLLETCVRLSKLSGTDTNLGLPSNSAWLSAALKETEGWETYIKRSQRWCAWQRASSDASLHGLSPLMNALQQGRISPDELSFAFELSYARWWIDCVVNTEQSLREFLSEFHEDAISRFVKLDEEVAELSRKVVTARLSKHIPPRNAFGKDPEWGMLSRELAKKARHMPIRQLFRQSPNALTTLAPCMMMSPLSIAQYLPTEATLFDVVIFDEASQMPVWDAIGAIARGNQVIVVGDPKQLPPTTFFDRSDSDTDDAAELEDLESILDECLAANIPHKRLNWHYRSRHESLIAFSNERYYDGRLVTFPSPVTDDRAVHYVHVPGGIYERGSARVNRAEANAVVADVVRRLQADQFAAEQSSIGIVTFNSEQQRLIENLLDQARRSNPGIERYFGSDWHEPVFVKNLESVQGDERDVILFSVAYGPDAASHLTQNYGPLNLDGGARRLNVAITRARTELVVFATLKPELIDLARAKGTGVRDFKHFLEFAQRGRSALTEASAPTGREEDSEFERVVRKALEANGWIVHAQVGVSGFRIDLAIIHPDAPGRYLAAVECDGATYHRSATARDRDKLREAVLRRLGWRVRRVWSTDWWNDAERALGLLQRHLEADLDEERAKERGKLARETQVSTDPSLEKSGIGLRDAVEQLPEHENLTYEGGVKDKPPISALALDEAPDVTAGPPSGRQIENAVSLVPYRTADLAEAGFVPEPHRFYETSYRPSLRRMVAHVVSTEGPIFEDLLVRRIARFHGFQRAGSQIKEVIMEMVERRFPRSVDGERKVFWPEGSSRTLDICRISDAGVRDLNETPTAELLALANTHLRNGSSPEETALLMAADLRLGRTRQTTRDRLEVIARKAKKSEE